MHLPLEDNFTEPHLPMCLRLPAPGSSPSVGVLGKPRLGREESSHPGKMPNVKLRKGVLLPMDQGVLTTQALPALAGRAAWPNKSVHGVAQRTCKPPPTTTLESTGFGLSPVTFISLHQELCLPRPPWWMHRPSFSCPSRERQSLSKAAPWSQVRG